MLIKISETRITKAQLNYIEGLLNRIQKPVEFKFQIIPRLIGRQIDFLFQLTKRESSIVIKALLAELGEN